MESAGLPNKIQISEDTYKFLKTNRSFRFDARGSIKVSGIGDMNTYFVYRSDPSAIVPHDENRKTSFTQAKFTNATTDNNLILTRNVSNIPKVSPIKKSPPSLPSIPKKNMSGNV